MQQSYDFLTCRLPVAGKNFGDRLFLSEFAFVSFLWSSPGDWEVMVEKSCCNDSWRFANPVLHQISSLLQWLTKKSSEWGKDQLNENKATFMAFLWRNEYVSSSVFYCSCLYSQLTENMNAGQECKKWEGKDG